MRIVQVRVLSGAHSPSHSMQSGIFRKLLLHWYSRHKRELPWRDICDPYRIWISEIILQQTRIAQGLDYYERFLTRFPDVQSLAAAAEDEVLKLWEGLGYYSRARNLHAAATILPTGRTVFPPPCAAPAVAATNTASPCLWIYILTSGSILSI